MPVPNHGVARARAVHGYSPFLLPNCVPDVHNFIHIPIHNI
jgi:hypothetical protein